ncbi:hypothetical protein Tco_0655708 [Tanacetum coccineum]|uniref:Uncharacterized protein n=1 Tax=Tanacetum coccineum TaxID=301880 RepID=A0ABQ4X6T6_9ASTR
MGMYISSQNSCDFTTVTIIGESKERRITKGIIRNYYDREDGDTTPRFEDDWEVDRYGNANLEGSVKRVFIDIKSHGILLRRLRICDATAVIQLWDVHMYMMIPKDCHHPGGRHAYIGAYLIYLDNCDAFLKHNDSEDTSSAEGCQFGKELPLLIYILSTSLLLHLLFYFYFFRKPEKNKKNLLSTFSKGLLVGRE